MHRTQALAPGFAPAALLSLAGQTLEPVGRAKIVVFSGRRWMRDPRKWTLPVTGLCLTVQAMFEPDHFGPPCFRRRTQLSVSGRCFNPRILRRSPQSPGHARTLMASNLRVMACNLVVMASNLRVMASSLRVMASNLTVMASNL